MTEQTPDGPATLVASLTLWEYSEQVRATWTAAEDELARAARWLVLIVVVQVLSWGKLEPLGPDPMPRKLPIFGLKLEAPDALIGVGLAVAAAYWVQQYIYAWSNISTAIRYHQTAIAQLVGQGTEGDVSHAALFRVPLTPARSVAGRPPTRTVEWLSVTIGRWGGLVIVLLVAAFEAITLYKLTPAAGTGCEWTMAWASFHGVSVTSCAWETAWVASAGLIVYWIGVTWFYLFARDPSENIKNMLLQLERTNVLVR